MPERRRPSRVPSPDSMAKLRWVASTVENSTASQKSPGAAECRTLGRGPRAKADRRSTEHGEGQHLPQRHPGADLDAQVLARHQQGVTPHRRHPAPRRVSGRRPPPARLGHPTAGHDHHPVGQRDGQVRLVGGQQHRRAPAGGLGHQLAQEVPGPGVEAGVRLVEQPQLRGPRHQRGQGHPPPLAGRQPADRGPPQAAGQPQPVERGLAPRRRAGRRPGRRTARSRPPSARRRGGRRGRGGPPGTGPRCGPRPGRSRARPPRPR